MSSHGIHLQLSEHGPLLVATYSFLQSPVHRPGNKSFHFPMSFHIQVLLLHPQQLILSPIAEVATNLNSFMHFQLQFLIEPYLNLFLNIHMLITEDYTYAIYSIPNCFLHIN